MLLHQDSLRFIRVVPIGLVLIIRIHTPPQAIPPRLRFRPRVAGHDHHSHRLAATDLDALDGRRLVALFTHHV